MAIHLYMSVGKLQEDGRLVDVSTGEETNVMRYRGEVGVDDDHKSFAKKMAEKGFIVEVHPEIVGEEIERKVGQSIQKSFEYNLGEL